MQEELESFMNCANNLFDELEFTKKQAVHLCTFLFDMPEGKDKNSFENDKTQLKFCLVTRRRQNVEKKCRNYARQDLGFIHETKIKYY